MGAAHKGRAGVRSGKLRLTWMHATWVRFNLNLHALLIELGPGRLAPGGFFEFTMRDYLNERLVFWTSNQTGSSGSRWARRARRAKLIKRRKQTAAGAASNST